MTKEITEIKCSECGYKLENGAAGEKCPDCGGVGTFPVRPIMPEEIEKMMKAPQQGRVVPY